MRRQCLQRVAVRRGGALAFCRHSPQCEQGERASAHQPVACKQPGAICIAPSVDWLTQQPRAQQLAAHPVAHIVFRGNGAGVCTDGALECSWQKPALLGAPKARRGSTADEAAARVLSASPNSKSSRCSGVFLLASHAQHCSCRSMPAVITPTFQHLALLPPCSDAAALQVEASCRPAPTSTNASLAPKASSNASPARQSAVCRPRQPACRCTIPHRTAAAQRAER